MALEADSENDPAESSAVAAVAVEVGEARWPMAGAVVAAMVLTALLPDAVRAGPSWLLPSSRACCSSLSSQVIREGSAVARVCSELCPSRS